MTKRPLWMSICVAVAFVVWSGAGVVRGVEAKAPGKTVAASGKQQPAPMVFPDPSKDPTRPAAGGVRWYWPTHGRNVARRNAGKIDLCFLGDSITQGWPGDLFGRYYGKLNGVNFGCGGDKIQHLLMRLQGDDGELKGTSPKVIVLMIGVNNMGDNTPAEIAYGIDNMVKFLKKECPKSKILVLGILPGSGGTSEKLTETNKLIGKLDDKRTVRFLDMGPKFLDKNGKALEGVHSDGVHLTHKGYEIWAATMDPLLKMMMK